MKRLLTLISLIGILSSIGAYAQTQGFKLYFANNVSDLEKVSAINENSANLNWREVQHNGDVYTNAAEVADVMKMFASPDMKNLKQQQQFWRMRDHSLLCFRINDGQGDDAYGVEASDGNGNVLNLTVSRYFYANMPLQEAPVNIRVWKIGEVGDTLRFQYHVHDWDDRNLYIFQLDSKRQADGEEYKLDYVLGYSDNSGLLKEDTITLKLQRNNFQSFYVPSGKDLVDVFLSSGSATSGEKAKRLRINKNRLHPGAGTDYDFNNLSLTPSFKLDRHVNRELVNFNWIGSGLFESFDTLYVKLRRPTGLPVVSVDKINVARVDANGNYLPNNQVKYLGYDESREAHLILTMGNPVYVEVIARGYFPTVYKFPGAYDPLTGIVDEERCTAEVLMMPGSVGSSKFNVSNQHFLGLRDTKRVVVYQGEDHALCDLEDVDLAGQPATSTIFFAEDGGQEAPKLMNGNEIDKYAELLLTFSKSKNSGGDNMKSTELVAYDSETFDELAHISSESRDEDNIVIPIFAYDYYSARFNLCDLPLDHECQLQLLAGDDIYENLPMFKRFHFDREQYSKDADDEVLDKTMGNVTENDPMKMGGADSDAGFDVGVPASLSWSPECLKGSPRSLKLKFAWYISILKKRINFKASLDYGIKSKGDSVISAMRDESKELGNWDKFKEEGTFANQGAVTKYGGVDGCIVSDGSAAKLDGWIYKEIDDIFAIPTPGHSLNFNFSVAGFYKLNDPQLVISEGGGKITYSYGLLLPNLMDQITGRLGKPGEWINKYLTKLKLIDCRAVWQGGFDLDFKVKNWTPAETGYDADGWGLLLTLTGKMRTGAWMELHTPSNPFLHLGAGVRAGMKVAAGVGYGTDFRSHNDVGGLLMGIGVLNAYAYIRSCVVTGKASAECHLGDRLLFPANDHNPFHEKYPYWAPAKPKANTNSLWDEGEDNSFALWTPQLSNTSSTPALSRVRRAVQAPEDSDFGTAVVTNVNNDANPHFLGENDIVYNDPANPDDCNDDHIAVLNTTNNGTTVLSTEGMMAGNHMRSKNSDYEIVAYEEMTRKVTESDVNSDDEVAVASELSKQKRIVANLRKQNGDWQKTVVCEKSDVANAKPVVTIQEDGHAACVWQRGVIKKSDNQEVADNEYYNNYLDGSLVLSTFDGKNWSAPVELFKLDETHAVQNYDLVMRNDTVLVGTKITENLLDVAKRSTQFTFVSVPLASKTPSYVKEQINPMRFFMNRVGGHAVALMLYEKNDSVRDIYVKTLKMNGVGDGLAGNDLGVNFCAPEKVKIVCDRSASKLSDFAVLWTEMNNTAHGSDGTAKNTGKARMMLNASRVALTPTLRVASPLTLGAETDDLTMLDYDGFLDDQHIKVVYTLADVATSEAIIMSNERMFTNSYNFEVNYDRSSLLGSTTLPVSITVVNTGTSAIENVTATINGKDFPVDDSYVQPLSRRQFVVNYPIDDKFDGYLSTQVTAEYDNVFRAKTHAGRRGMSLVRQQTTAVSSHITMENIEMRLIGQGIEDGTNIFTVELIDRSARGLDDNNEIHVGLYAHPAIPVLISDESMAVVKKSDFHSFGGVRKAYATIQLHGVAETTEGFLNAYIYDTKQLGTSRELVQNLSFSDNTHYVIMQPSNDPTYIRAIHSGEQKANHDVKVTEEDGGVRISGLTTAQQNGGTTRVRVFNSSGVAVYSEVTNKESVFVPLKSHDVYLLSTGKDVLKFTF